MGGGGANFGGGFLGEKQGVRLYLILLECKSDLILGAQSTPKAFKTKGLGIDKTKKKR